MTKHKKIAILILTISVTSNFFVNNIHILFHTKVAAMKRVVANRREFTPEEDAKIKDFVQRHGESNWERCTEILPERNARSIRCRWNNNLKSVDVSPLTQEEKKTLVEAITVEGKHWAIIAEKYFGNNRTSRKLKGAYRSIEKLENSKSSISPSVENPLDILNPLDNTENYLFETQNSLSLYDFSSFDTILDEGLPNTTCFSGTQNSNLETKELEATKCRKKRFTLEEDAIIEKFVQENGACKWEKCANLLPNRSRNSIKERWVNALRPERRDNSNFRPEEIETLLEACAVCGPKWAYINRKYFNNKKRLCKLKNEYNLAIKQHEKLNLIESLLPTNI